MVASLTPLPVIGVPVRATRLDGVDSLLSIVQVGDSLTHNLQLIITSAIIHCLHISNRFKRLHICP